MSLILKSPSIATFPRPKLVRDPLIRPRTKVLYDFTDPRCHPGGVITPGARANQLLANDLVSGVAANVIGSGRFVVNADGSVSNTLVSTTAQHIAIGSVGQFNQNPEPNEFVAILWAKIPTGADISGSKSLMHMGAGGTSSSSFLLSFGGAGASPYGVVVGATGAGAGGGFGSAPPRDVPTQWAIRWVPGEKVDVYQNGVVIGSDTTSVPTTLYDTSAYFFRLPAMALCTFYRVLLTDLAGSSEDEADLGYASSQIVSGHDYIVRDYQFCTNAIPAAPKTVFA